VCERAIQDKKRERLGDKKRERGDRGKEGDRDHVSKREEIAKSKNAIQ
jgi:hypothetical protein